MAYKCLYCVYYNTHVLLMYWSMYMYMTLYFDTVGCVLLAMHAVATNLCCMVAKALL
jgi:hypothetical protein